MKKRQMAVLALWASACAAGPAWSGVPLADKVPAQTLVYVGWAGRSLTLDGSLFGQLIADPDVRGVLGAVHTAVSRQLAEEKDGLATFNHLWAMGKIAWQHPCAVALFDISAPPMREGRRRGEPRPAGAVLIALGKDKAAFEGELQGLLAVAGKELKITQAAVGDVSYHRFDTPAGPCGLGFAGDIFFMSLGEKAPETITSLAGGKAKSLAASGPFAAAMKAVCGESVQMAWYFNVARACEVMDKLMPRPPAATAPAAPSDFRRAVKALGVDRVTALAGAANILDRGIHEKSRIFSPAPHRGLLMPLSGAPLAPEALAGVPADADVVASARLDVGKLVGEFNSVVAGFEPESVARIDAALAGAGKQFALNIEKDLLANLGDQWTLYSAESLGGFLTGTVLSVTVKDAAKLQDALRKIEEVAKGMMGRSPAGGRRGRGFTIRSFKSGAVEVHYVAAIGRRALLPVAPAWAVHKGRLYLAAFPQVVVAAASGTARKPLAGDADFAALRKRVAAAPSALLYVNSPRLIRRLYGLGLVGWTLGANALTGELGPAFAPEMLPALPRLERYIRPDIAVMTSDARGITFESYGSLPGGGWLSSLSPLQAMSVGMLLPALGQARVQAQRAVTMTHLRQIAVACEMYHAQHRQYPPDLLKLVEKNILPANVLFSPQSGRRPRLDSGGKPIGPFDYVYLAPQVALPPNMVLAYERPEINRGKGSNVLFADGHVEWMPMPKFRRELKKTQDYIARQSK